MDDQRTSYPYRQFIITTLRYEGVWWARARVTAAAKVAAEAFCDRRKAG